MRFADAAARLAEIPERLPPAPKELLPTVLAHPAAAAELPLAAGSTREAAVLLLIHPDDAGEAHIVLTERTAGGHRHAGQISFPGGAVEPDDESVVAAALREAREEVGLEPAAAGLRVVRVLAPVEVRVSGFLVHPVLAIAEHPLHLVADAREVAGILDPPLSAFLPPAPIEIVTAEREDGYRLRYGAYRLGERLVWGATAGILGRLAAFLAG